MEECIKKSIMQDPEDNHCFICYAWANDTHHIFGGSKGNRDKSTEDGLTVRLCRRCHCQLHDHNIGMSELRIAGQMKWEQTYGTREQFRERYGKSYI